MFLASPITFPNLGITVDPNPVAFTVFGKDIYWYGIIIALGFLLAVIYMMRRAPVFGLTQDDVLDEVLWAVPIGVICARLYYCIFYWELYADNPISILYIWEGGLAIYGGVIGGAITILVVSRVKKIKTGTMLDIAAMAVLIGQIFGRWGNFMNREAFGAETDIFCRMGLIAPDGSTIYVHPTFLYESLWNLCVQIFLIILERKGKRRYDGQCITLYFLLYGIGRTWIEGLRTDSLYIGATNIRVSQVLSTALVIIALAYLIIQGRREHPPEKLYVNMRAAQETTEPNGGEEQTEADNETEEK